MAPTPPEPPAHPAEPSPAGEPAGSDAAAKPTAAAEPTAAAGQAAAGQAAAEPVTPEPVAVEPVIVKPVAAEPVAVEPTVVGPVAAEPVAVEPVAVTAVPSGSAAASASAGRGRHRGGRGRAGRRGVLALAGAALAGIGLIVAAFLVTPAGPPQPADDVSGRYQLTDTDRRPDARGIRPLDRSAPVRVRIPSIRLDAVVVTVGTNPDGSLQVPELRHPEWTGWYRYGPSPGERGNAVIVGHVDTRAKGPAVFFELGALKPGTKIEVSRLDGSVATFAVDAVKSFPKEEFPAPKVYGSTEDMGLRLVTCGPPYDRTDRNYLNNVVVFATLARTKPAPATR